MANTTLTTASTTPTMRIRLYRIAGAAVVVGVSAGSVVLAPKWPWASSIATVLCWYVGKLLGIPTNEIIAAALSKKDPMQIAQIAMNAITAMPVDAISPTAVKVMESLRPIAEGRVTVESIPPVSAPPVEFLNVELEEPVADKK